MKLKTALFVLAYTFACLSCSTEAWAQAGTGELAGLVTDATGAVVPGVEVDLVNSATGIARQTLSSSAGVYRFVSLPIVGTYTLAVQQPGFKAARVEGIVMTVGTTITHDIKLEVGAPADVVTVTSGAEVVQATESAVSTLVDRNVWQNMPLEVRNQNTFINLVAGAVPDAMAGSYRGAAVNGARGGTGNYLVEGVDNNDQGLAGGGQLSYADPGGAATSISPDAIGEYRVITNSFAAEYGKAGGFVTDTVLKSGTNHWHGSLFEYNRVQALAANGFFSNANGLKDSLVRNQFGGSVGGPIIKDKAFFFYSMEWHRFRQANSLSATGTTQQYLDWVKTGGLQQWAESDPNGVCMQNLGAPCPAKFSQSATLGPIFSGLAATGPFPLATSGFSNTGAGFYTTDLQYPVPVYGDVFVSNPYHLNEYRISAKVDYQLTNKDLLSGLYLNQTANQGDLYSCGGTTIGPACINDGRGQNWGVTWNHIFGPAVTNTLKASYLRHRSDFPAPPGTMGIPMIVTAFDPLGVGLGPVGVPQLFTDTQYQVQNHVSIIRGKHSFKTGAEYRRTVNASSFYANIFGTFLPYGIEDLVTDLAFTDEADLAVLGALTNGSVYSASAAVDPTTGQLPDPYRGYRANEFAAYFQDDWRVSQRLTVNWGLRWEYFGVPHNYKPNIDSNFYFGVPVTPIETTSNNPFFPANNPFYASVSTGTFQVRNNELWNKDTNNFGPRLGFAYDMLGNQRLILRAGAGIMYDRIYNNVFENMRFNPPYYSINQIGSFVNGVPVGALSTPGLYTVPFTSTPAFASGGLAPKPSPRHMDQNMVSPYYEQMHLGIQWEFFKGYALGMEYVSTMGHKLPGYYDINTFNGRLARGYSTTRINTNIGADNYRNNGFSSNYHGAQATVRKNFSGGLGLNASYTWSRALDNLSDVFNTRDGGITDTMNLRMDYGPADFNMTNRFVGTVSYELPLARHNPWVGGWQLNAIISLQSGVPFSPISTSSSSDVNKNGVPNDRIVYTGSGGPLNSLKEGTSPADGYFDATLWAMYVCSSSVNGGLWCSSPQGRGTMTGPSYQNVDFNVIKRFRIKEGSSVSLQGAFFNLFNHPNFKLPDFSQTSSAFGRSRSAYNARITQLALRIDF